MIEKLAKLATFTPSVLTSLSVSLYSLIFYLFVFPYTKMMTVILDLMLPPCLILIQDCTCWRRGYRGRENSLNIWTRWWEASPETPHAVSDGVVCVICGRVGGVCAICEVTQYVTGVCLFWICYLLLNYSDAVYNTYVFKRENIQLFSLSICTRPCVCLCMMQSLSKIITLLQLLLS